jgi:hypothetical protein
MVTCANAECGAQLAAADAFCGYCGTPQNQAALAVGDRGGNAAGLTAATVVRPVPSPAPPGAGDAAAAPPWAPPPALSPAPGPAPGPGAAGQPAGHPAAAATDALLGQAAPNTVYLGQRLQYEKERDLEQLDPLASTRYWRELLMHAGLVYLISFLGAVVVVVVAFVLTLIASTFGAVLGGLLVLAWAVLMACVFWLRKLSSQLSEWKFQLDGKGAAAATAFDHIGWSLQRRGTPVDTLELRRFQVPGQGARDLLVIRQGIFYGLVSCFANGDDLYIGWTLWLYLSPARLLWIGIRRLFWEFRFRGHAIYVSLQFDRAKALREAMHSAVREGVDVAAGQATPQGHGTLGSVIPVVADDTFGQAPWIAAVSQPATA